MGPVVVIDLERVSFVEQLEVEPVVFRCNTLLDRPIGHERLENRVELTFRYGAPGRSARHGLAVGGRALGRRRHDERSFSELMLELSDVREQEVGLAARVTRDVAAQEHHARQCLAGVGQERPEVRVQRDEDAFVIEGPPAARPDQ